MIRTVVIILGFLFEKSVLVESQLDLGLQKLQRAPTLVDLKDRNELLCREGYGANPPDSYSDKFMDCEDRLKDAGGIPTIECIQICMYKEFKWAGNKLDRVEMFNHYAIIETFPNDPGRTSFINDVSSCWNKTTPRMKLDGRGCEQNVRFTECMKEKSVDPFSEREGLSIV